ncbi:DNA polymerase-3 subunit epsilon [Allopseudospirillum japonicum]|uniref:DNA polymerase-3 subunit epsilon n=1 Tax=Allopseudospirillum japonicum TaxID=64971 RepID=A0A1H6R058_9GAMM|nr:3'-5' exonuclease [Allopseudospirillum japonicum]SEI49398.1 DNA polymerase-3 subunit epsilon [Allopseudospirillum japonicum]
MFYLSQDELQDQQIPDWPHYFATLARQARHPSLRAFYQQGVVAAQTPLAEVPLMAMDFETTSLDARTGGILSIGLVPMRLQRIYCHQARHWLLKPRAPLPESSIVIHKITHSEVAKAPDLQDILDVVLAQMAGHIMVVHHQGIERPFLQAACKARIGEGIEFPVIDTMQLEARIHRRKRMRWIDALLGRKPVSIRLADARQRYNLPFYTAHHALTDALATAELLQAQVAHRFSADVPVGDLWS